MPEPTRAELIRDVKLQLAEFVSFRERMGDPVTFQRILLDHRRQVEQCLRDDPEGPWRERLGWLDDLCREEGIAW